MEVGWQSLHSCPLYANVTHPLYKEHHVLFLTMIWDQKYLFISRLLQSVIEFDSKIFEFIVREIKNISNRNKILIIIMMLFFYRFMKMKKFFLNINIFYSSKNNCKTKLVVLKIVAIYVVMISSPKKI